MKLGNPHILQPFKNLFWNFRLRHGKIPKIAQPFEANVYIEKSN